MVSVLLSVCSVTDCMWDCMAKWSLFANYNIASKAALSNTVHACIIIIM